MSIHTHPVRAPDILTSPAIKIWDAINDGTIYSCPSLLSSFVISSFADLKNYKFHYWFAFPAIHSDPAWIPSQSTVSHASDSRQSEDDGIHKGKHLTQRESATLVDAVQTWSYAVDGRQRGFFLARKQRKNPGPDTQATQQGTDSADSTWTVASLSEYENGFFDGAEFQDRYVCFADPSNYETAPGWMLRNLLVVVKCRWGLDRVQILRYRDVQSKRDQGRSIVIQLETRSDQTSTAKPPSTQGTLPKVTGWERNPAGKLSGRMVNLTEYMDPKRCDDGYQLPPLSLTFLPLDWQTSRLTST